MKNINEDIFELRRNNLRNVIERYFCSIQECADKIGLHRSNLSSYLSGSRDITTPMSHRIENALQLPFGSLTEKLENNIDFIFNVTYYENIAYINDSSKESNIKISKKMADLMFDSNSDKIILLKMHDNLMAETIRKNELYLVDCNQNTVTEGGVYLCKYLDTFIVRRFQILEKGVYQLSHDNISVKINISSINKSSINIIGKIVTVIREI